MEKKRVKRIPYGIADFEAIQKGGLLYVDKTGFLEKIEDAGAFLFFLRPRRFGKSLWLSVMESYYDIAKADVFEELYAGLSIYDNPTDSKNFHLMFTLNFSAVNPDIRLVGQSFVDYIRLRVLSFIHKYSGLIETDSDELSRLKHRIEESRDASFMMNGLIDFVSKSKLGLYILIDEYDNFANTILSTLGTNDYQGLTHGEGFFRSFFNVIKAGTTGSSAPISRLFITGVSPITMDDVTIGFNIGENISIDSQFNEMLGFTEDEVREIIDYYISEGLIDQDADMLLEQMRGWYNNYLFSVDADFRVYNTDMALYFINQYIKEGHSPRDMLDHNVKIDYGKLRHLITIDRQGKREPNGNFSMLKQIIEDGEMRSHIVKSFPVEKITDSNNFISQLFFFGLLTIEKEKRGKLNLIIPNEIIRRMFYEYIRESYREAETFRINMQDFYNLMANMAYDGEWMHVFEYFAEELSKHTSLRDYITGEKVVHGFLLAYLSVTNFFILHSEREMNKGYADIVMEPFMAGFPDMEYSYILEIKYIKPSEYGEEIKNRKIDEAREQLERYSVDDRFKKSIERTTLKKIILIFSGHELKVFREFI